MRKTLESQGRQKLGLGTQAGEDIIIKINTIVSQALLPFQ